VWQKDRVLRITQRNKKFETLLFRLLKGRTARLVSGDWINRRKYYFRRKDRNKHVRLADQQKNST
jgi:hypothetical protein